MNLKVTISILTSLSLMTLLFQNCDGMSGIQANEQSSLGYNHNNGSINLNSSENTSTVNPPNFGREHDSGRADNAHVTVYGVEVGDKVSLFFDSDCKRQASKAFTVKKPKKVERWGITAFIKVANLKPLSKYNFYAKSARNGVSSNCSPTHLKFKTIETRMTNWNDPGEVQLWERSGQYTTIRNESVTINIPNRSEASFIAQTTVSWPYFQSYQSLSAVSRIRINGVNCGREKISIPSDAQKKPNLIRSSASCKTTLGPGTYNIEFRGRGWSDSQSRETRLDGGSVYYWIVPVD